ncbi:hypothetical protein QTN25_008508 [Entamoeba marina]
MGEIPDKAFYDDFNNLSAVTIENVKSDKNTTEIISTDSAKKKSSDVKDNNLVRTKTKERVDKTKKRFKPLLKSTSSRAKDEKQLDKTKTKTNEKKKPKKPRETSHGKEEKRHKEKKIAKIEDKEEEVKKKEKRKEKKGEKKDNHETKKLDRKKQQEPSNSSSIEEKKPKRSRFSDSKDVQKTIKQLGFFDITQSIFDADVVVVEETKRTEKVLDAIVRSIPIVNQRYIDDCRNSNEELDILEYRLTETFPGIKAKKEQIREVFTGKTIGFYGKPKINEKNKYADVINKKHLQHSLKEDVQIVDERWLYDCIDQMAIVDFRIYRTDLTTFEDDGSSDEESSSDDKSSEHENVQYKEKSVSGDD